MFSSVWMYAWDLQDEGLENVLGFMRDAGVDAINMASAYHAGYFIHSHNPSHKMYFPEDGVVYFQPDGRFFQGTPLKPQVASVSAETDWFAAAGEQLDRYGLKLVAWTVCTHNTRLGMAHPAHVVRNAFGDPYYHALCPSNPDVRRYIRGLCRNLAARYPMYAVQMESPGFMGMEHGHHHERYGTVLRPLELWLISLCFCHACRRGAREHGLDMDAIAAAVKTHLADYFESAPMPPQGQPRDREEMLAAVPHLTQLESFRHGVETSLIREVRQDLRSLGETRLFVLEGY
ncbi:MAG: hypothetical protein Q8P22_01865, partial [Chloroflexota bacterium]|nr:hypothetical protein [Chloroflexota bacterium]